MKILVVIPARYGSTRFAGKVLAKDTGKFLVQHTYEKACLAKLPDRVLIAADDKRIADAAVTFGAECVMTSANHQSGTDRIAEAAKDIDADIVVNLQADEPEIDPENIDLVAQLLIDNPDFQMATLATVFKNPKQVQDPNIVKVITDRSGKAIYFSRSVIPYDRDNSGLPKPGDYLQHLGIYAYRKEFLLKITTLSQSTLEKTEKLEQLRVIENGYSILVGKTQHICEGIDTSQQYAGFVARYLSRKNDINTGKGETHVEK